MCRTTFLLAVVNCVLCAGLAKAQGRSWLGGEQNESERRVYEALDQTAPLDFEEQPLSEFIDYLREVTKLDIVIDHKSLAEAGSGTDVPVTIQVKQVSYKSALKLLLDPLDLTWVFRDGVVYITSKTEAENMLAIKIYNVRNLVSESSSGEIDFRPLIRLVTCCVAPTTWDEVGGPGSIIEYRGPHICAIVVSQTREVHDEIASLFGDMRKLAEQAPVEAAVSGSSRAVVKRANAAVRRNGFEAARARAAAPEWSLPRVHE